MNALARVYQCTDVGRVRPSNEDSASCFSPGVCVVADGMGGRAAGEVASALLVHAAESFLQSCKGRIREEELAQAIRCGNQSILDDVKKYPEYLGMGTTATIFHYEDKNGFWAHVGDSRLYLLRGGKICQLTRDHSYVEDLVASGSITREEARIHPQKNMLTRAVGISENLSVDTGSFEIQPSDMVLLSTDGLTNMVDDALIESILMEEHANPARVLVDAALAAGGKDNVTAVVVTFP